MNFYPAQICELVGISVETLRHWRGALPPLYKKSGRSACFHAGDALALEVVKLITHEFGVKVSCISPVAEQLFSSCDQRNWPRLERSAMLISISNKHVQLLKRSESLDEEGAYWVIPIDQLVADLRARMLSEEGYGRDRQGHLPYSPIEIKAGTR